MHIFGFNPSSSLHKHPSWSYLFWNPVSSQLKIFLFWYDFSSDVNEAPTGLCSAPIIISMKTSIGAVIAKLQGDDPDNEIAIQNDPSNQSVIIRNKQQLTYSLSPQQNSWPFGIKTDSLFKSAVSMMYKWYPVITILRHSSSLDVDTPVYLFNKLRLDGPLGSKRTSPFSLITRYMKKVLSSDWLR